MIERMIPFLAGGLPEHFVWNWALLAMVGTGLRANVEEACDAAIRVVDSCEPDADRVLEYDRWFKEYQAAYRALAPGFRRVAEII